MKPLARSGIWLLENLDVHTNVIIYGCDVDGNAICDRHNRLSGTSKDFHIRIEEYSLSMLMVCKVHCHNNVSQLPTDLSSKLE